MKPNALEWVMNEVSLQDFVWGLSSIAYDNYNGFKLVNNYIINNYERVKNKIGVATMLLTSCLNISMKSS